MKTLFQDNVTVSQLDLAPPDKTALALHHLAPAAPLQPVQRQRSRSLPPRPPKAGMNWVLPCVIVMSVIGLIEIAIIFSMGLYLSPIVQQFQP